MVYIDNMYKIPLGKFGRMKMSHMIADSQQELLEMVDKIGVKRRYIQHKGMLGEHFDIAIVKRKLAIQFGAKEIHWRDYAAMIEKRCLENRVNIYVASITHCNTNYKI